MRFGRRADHEPSVRVRRLEPVTSPVTPWRLPWPVMAGVAALLTAATSWLLVAGFCILGWIAVPEMKVASVLHLATQGWLLAHGISVALPGAQLSIVPLGLTAIVAALGLGLTNQAAIHSPPPQPGMVGARLGRLSAVFGLVYVIALTAARSWTEGDRAGQTSLLWAAGLVFALGLAGFGRALAWRIPDLPVWLRAGGRAVLAGVCVMIATGAAVVITALVTGRDRIALVQDSLEPGGLGTAMRASPVLSKASRYSGTFCNSSSWLLP